MTHLTEKELNGYIHHTLTDAQRETMDRHIQACPDCRTALKSAEQVRRDIAYGLADEIRRARPSATMRFNQIQAGLNQKRRWSMVRFHSMQMLSAVGVLVAILGMGYLVLLMMQNAAAASPPPAITSQEIAESADIVQLFDEEWTNPDPYKSGLISEQQMALVRLQDLPIYHIDMEVSDDLQWVNGRQQLRYINQTSQTLDHLVFILYPNQTYGSLDVYDVEVNGRPARSRLSEAGDSLTVNLAEPLRPGDTTIVEMAFALGIGRSWQVAPTLGQPYHEVLHLVQFQPTLAVFDEDKGWDLTQPKHNLSYNTQSAFYRLRVSMPTSQNVIGSGNVISRELVSYGEEAREVVTMSAGPIDELYLTISERFQVAVTEVVGETRINSYAHSPEQLEDAQKALEYARAAVWLYNDQIGAYPFTELDIVNAPSLAFARQGIAYSGVVLLEHDPFQYTLETQENVVLYQVGTQWFDPTVSTIRLNEPWLADGLAEFATYYFYELFFSPIGLAELESGWTEREERSGTQLDLPATAYGDLAYFNAMHGSAPMFITAVAEEMGRTNFDNFLKEYYQTYRWGGADAVTFQTLAEKHCQCDLNLLFAEWGVKNEP